MFSCYRLGQSWAGHAWGCCRQGEGARAGVNFCWRFSTFSILSPAMDYSALNLDSVAVLGSTQAPWPEPVPPPAIQGLLFCLQMWGEAASCLPRDHQNMLRNLDCAPCLEASKLKDSESVRTLLKQNWPSHRVLSTSDGVILYPLSSSREATREVAAS